MRGVRVDDGEVVAFQTSRAFNALRVCGLLWIVRFILRFQLGIWLGRRGKE